MIVPHRLTLYFFVSDLSMPWLIGCDVLKEAQSKAKYSNVKFVTFYIRLFLTQWCTALSHIAWSISGLFCSCFFTWSAHQKAFHGRTTDVSTSEHTVLAGLEVKGQTSSRQDVKLLVLVATDRWAKRLWWMKLKLGWWSCRVSVDAITGFVLHIEVNAFLIIYRIIEFWPAWGNAFIIEANSI